MTDVFIINLPSPPKMNVFRDWAGGYGTALESKRIYPGHDSGFFEVPNIQFVYIAGMLRNNNIPFIYKNLQEEEKFQEDVFYMTLRNEKPKIFISSISLPSIKQDLLLLKSIKKNFEVKIILIGPIAKLFKEKILKDGCADYIIIEKEELITSEIVSAVIDGNNTPKGTYYLKEGSLDKTVSNKQMTDLNFLDFPGYEMLNFKKYQSTYPFNKLMRYTTLLTSKGCPYPCEYCPYPIGFGKRVLFRNPELVVKDIKRLVEYFNIEFLVFRDQVLTLNRKHCEKIFQDLIQQNIKVTWLCETRYDLVDDDLLDLMYRAGCREINYGLETGDELLFKKVGKSKSDKGLDYFGKIITATKKAGIRCHTHLMLGLPEDSHESIKKTIRFLKKYKPDSVQVAIFIPYPGTLLGNKIIKDKELENLDYSKYSGFNAVVPTKYMSMEEIEEARLHIYNVWDKSIPLRIKNKIKKWFMRLVY